MTRERAKTLASKWSAGCVCSLREGEAEEYHKMFYDLLCDKKDAKAEWISVDDRVPYHLQTVIALHKTGKIDVEEYRALELLNSFSRENFHGPVTHWMPIPESPAKEGAI